MRRMSLFSGALLVLRCFGVCALCRRQCFPIGQKIAIELDIDEGWFAETAGFIQGFLPKPCHRRCPAIHVTGQRLLVGHRLRAPRLNIPCREFPTHRYSDI